jgi:hypothetical protein
MSALQQLNGIPAVAAPPPMDRLDTVRFAEHQSPLFVEERRLGVFTYGETTAILGVERVRVNVQVTAADVQLVRGGSHAIHARLVTNESPPELAWSWGHQLSMNNVSVNVSQCIRKMRIKQFSSPFLTPMPADLSATTNEGINVISFQPSKAMERGIIVVQLVRVRKVPECVDELRRALGGESSVQPGQQTAAEVQDTLRTLAQRNNAAAAQDEDVKESAFILSLNDPLSLARIRVPTRTKSCSHLQCFDLRTFVEYSCREQYWHCPVCKAAAPCSALVVDAYFASILAATAHLSDEKVIIELDGSFSRLPSEMGDDSSSDSGRDAKQPGNKSAVRDILKNSAAPVLILDDDSDDSAAAVVPATAVVVAAVPTQAPTTVSNDVAMDSSRAASTVVAAVLSPTLVPTPAPTTAYHGVGVSSLESSQEILAAVDLSVRPVPLKAKQPSPPPSPVSLPPSLSASTTLNPTIPVAVVYSGPTTTTITNSVAPTGGVVPSPPPRQPSQMIMRLPVRSGDPMRPIATATPNGGRPTPLPELPPVGLPADPQAAAYMQLLMRTQVPPPPTATAPPVTTQSLPPLRALAIPPPKRARVEPGPNDDVIVLDSSE